MELFLLDENVVVVMMMMMTTRTEMMWLERRCVRGEDVGRCRGSSVR